MENQVIDIENLPLHELTLKDVLPYFRQLVAEEVKAKSNSIPLHLAGIKREVTEAFLNDPERYAFGMRGLANVLHCSVKTAYNYRSTGDYDPAIIQFGKRLIIDRVKATEIAQAQGKARKKKAKTL